MRRRHRPAQRLRQTIDRMPLETRCAMLDAIGANPIIVGAYTDGAGGLCPMLAAHRNGGRTSFAAFATAWDRYTRVGKGPRPATEPEVRALRAMLEASIASEADGGATGLGEAIAAHRASRAATEARPAPRHPGAEGPGRRLEARGRRVDGPGRQIDAIPGRSPASSRPAAPRDTGECDRIGELAHRAGWAWLRPFRSLDDYERALGELETTERACGELETS